MTAPHESDRFRDAASFSVEVIFTAPGSTPEAAKRHGEAVADRIAAAIAPLAHAADPDSVIGIQSSASGVLVGRDVYFIDDDTGRDATINDELDRDRSGPTRNSLGRGR